MILIEFGPAQETNFKISLCAGQQSGLAQWNGGGIHKGIAAISPDDGLGSGQRPKAYIAHAPLNQQLLPFALFAEAQQFQDRRFCRRALGFELCRQRSDPALGNKGQS